MKIATFGTVFASLCLSNVVLAQPAGPPAQSAQSTAAKRLHTWWRDPAPGQRPFTTGAKQLPRISVKGNKFVDPDGKTVVFRGLAISDPDKLEMQGHWSKGHFVKVKEMGGNLVRIPIHPVAWRERTPAEYIKLLDQAVGWCTELNMYVILDWHSIGNLQTELFQDPMYETTKQETYSFWRIMARHYAGHNTVAFYRALQRADHLSRAAWPNLLVGLEADRGGGDRHHPRLQSAGHPAGGRIRLGL